MNPRDTRTGGVLESMVLPALTRGGYKYDTQKVVGVRLGGRKHKVDILATKEGRNILISLKWQQTSGTAEQKVPYEIICLMIAVKENAEYEKAYLVLGGDGWSLKDFYLSRDLQDYIDYDSQVTILSLERFVALANDGAL